MGLIAAMLALPAISNATSPDNALVSRGEYLAKAGDCVACHTAPNGKPFAGGLPMTTPMGTIYTTNITPDPKTGIGNWTEAEFGNAMRRGISKDGHNLYPAMPYPSFAKVRDEDIAALYSYFLKDVRPVSQTNRPSGIPFPLNMRWPLKVWNLVFLDTTVYRGDDKKDIAWNRGAYLIQGLGHCGSCHTPRGIAFQEKAQDETNGSWLTGSLLDGWFATNLTSDRNTGLGRWSAGDIVQFLKTGANRHASAFGSMTDVINNSTQTLNDVDLSAMAIYLKSLPPAGGGGRPDYAYNSKETSALLARPANNPGALIYTTYCMHCHGPDGKAFAPFLAPLAGNPNVLQNNASSLVNITLNGTHDLVIAGVVAPYPMPGYAHVLSDRQIADVLTFIRSGWMNGAPAITISDVTKVRNATGR